MKKAKPQPVDLDSLSIIWKNRARSARDGFTSTDNYPGLDCGHESGVNPSLTDPSDAEDSDINKIVERALKTGVMPDQASEGLYGDFSDVPSYQEALHIVAHANEQFAALDARARFRFENNPEKFLAFVSDPRNAKEMVELGLATASPNDQEPPPRTPPAASPGAPKSETKDLVGS